VKKLAVGFILAVLCGICYAQQTVVAVMPFEIRDRIITQSEAEFATEVFSNNLASARVLTLVARIDIDEAIKKEFGQQMSDWSDENKTARMGEVLNAEWIIVGRFSKVGTRIGLTVLLFDLNTRKQMPGAERTAQNTDGILDSIPDLVKEIVYKLRNPGDGDNDPPPPFDPEGFVRIQGGTFMMGSPGTEVDRDNDEAQHRVTVRSFYMGQYEVSQREYEAVMGNNPSSFKDPNLPVEQVTWFDAVRYCNARSLKEGLTLAYTINGEKVTWNRNANGFRLPTEAEWEYACRAGTTGPFSTGNNITTSQANYNGNYPYNNNAKGTYRERSIDVGSFASNPWGLFNMHGNVWEWCWDWYAGYSMADQTDPAGAPSGTTRVLRGGSWDSGAQGLRSARRGDGDPSGRDDGDGFRVVRP
jgi:formylglycine-generating enzyme required for sulfatase activity/TolB-like protein